MKYFIHDENTGHKFGFYEGDDKLAAYKAMLWDTGTGDPEVTTSVPDNILVCEAVRILSFYATERPSVHAKTGLLMHPSEYIAEQEEFTEDAEFYKEVRDRCIQLADAWAQNVRVEEFGLTLARYHNDYGMTWV